VLLRSACWRSQQPSSSAAAKAAAPAPPPVDQVKKKSAGAAVQSSGRIRPAARLSLAREESRKEWLTRNRTKTEHRATILLPNPVAAHDTEGDLVDGLAKILKENRTVQDRPLLAEMAVTAFRVRCSDPFRWTLP
jgi:hypothetical protein